MKTRSILSALLGLALMAGGCASDEFERGGVSPTSPGVHVRLTGAAAPAARTRATVEATDGERTVNSVLAVLFDTHEGFYKTVPATRVGETDEYTFIVEKDATYDIWLVANASDELRSALEGIEPGTPMENAEGVSCLESIVAGQAPDADGQFLMVSKYSEKVTTRITETQSVGEVHMIRLAARFDLLNKAEGVTVKSITFKNRTVKSAVLTPNTMPTQMDWYEEKQYEVNVTGDPENGNPWEGHIYTYENNSVAGDFMRPELTITYTEGDDTQVKTHTVELVDPNSTAGTAMAVKRNNLYRIILTKATKLDFDLEVLDWEEADAIENPDLPLVLPADQQKALNEKLLVNMFTEYNVKSLDLSSKTVTEFYDKLAVGQEDVPITSMFTYNELKNAGLTANGEGAIIKDTDGNLYRLPTVGELMLLVPMIDNFQPGFTSLEYDEKNNALYHVPMWTGQSNIAMATDEFTEKVYLKNLDNGDWSTSAALDTESENGFSGKSQLLRGRAIEGLTFSSAIGTSEYGYDDIKSTKVYPVYAVRFKGTDQCSAYRYQTTAFEDHPFKRYLSIKIKALPKNTDYTVYDVTDNHSFWANDYIEIKIPLTGRYENNKLTYCGYGYLLSTSYIKNSQTPGLLYCFAGYSQINTGALAIKMPVRLVKVKKESEAEDQN